MLQVCMRHSLEFGIKTSLALDISIKIIQRTSRIQQLMGNKMAKQFKPTKKPTFSCQMSADVLKSEGDVVTYVGPFVHSLSWEDPCVLVPNGVIGVQDGKVKSVKLEASLEFNPTPSFVFDRCLVLLLQDHFCGHCR